MGNEKSLPDHRCNTVQTQHHHNRQHSRYHQPPAGQTVHRHSAPLATAVKPSATDRYSVHAKRHCVPDRDTHGSFSSVSRPPSLTAASCTKSYTSASTAYSAVTLSTRLSQSAAHKSTGAASRSNGANAAVAAVDSKQTKYLKEQLYIKSYLDIVEADRLARNQFKAAKPGIRNYTPKILSTQPALPARDVDVWI